jgi:hypothetical protein
MSDLMIVVAIMKKSKIEKLLAISQQKKKKRREFNVWEENCTIEEAQAKLKLFWIFKEGIPTKDF